MNNTRFATAIHILTLLAHYPDEWLSSDLIAASININPVIVRKELLVLKEAGFIESKMGKNGGCRLAKNSSEIVISEIYDVVKNGNILGKKNQNPNPKCDIGKDINQNLQLLFSETDILITRFLKQKTLADFTLLFT
ncbi:Rrf2 family transcriptional regulator [Fluviicola sp.]|jgi:Rrf2 family protein|uniref:RrF2 family transcriptional regulator n=1 Tax=Fluviicola sp. TaxID=1917219 RepID=UPI00282706C4|nr:Rrf2 family transcriptional regulator [Fluviicola sp.]MDR0802278.1 Rrf2 family transcriptional regulator [Fluviicola sp.]